MLPSSHPSGSETSPLKLVLLMSPHSLSWRRVRKKMSSPILDGAAQRLPHPGSRGGSAPNRRPDLHGINRLGPALACRLLAGALSGPVYGSWNVCAQRAPPGVAGIVPRCMPNEHVCDSSQSPMNASGNTPLCSVYGQCTAVRPYIPGHCCACVYGCLQTPYTRTRPRTL